MGIDIVDSFFKPRVTDISQFVAANRCCPRYSIINNTYAFQLTI